VAEKRADLFVVCGDITNFGRPTGFARKLMDSIPVRSLAVPGTATRRGGHGDLLRSRGANIHEKRAKINGIVFAGLGGAKTSPNALPFELPEEMMFKGLDPVMKDGCVLVTHCPAAGHLDSPAPG